MAERHWDVLLSKDSVVEKRADSEYEMREPDAGLPDPPVPRPNKNCQMVI